MNVQTTMMTNSHVTILTHWNGANSTNRSRGKSIFYLFFYSTNFFLQLDYMCMIVQIMMTMNGHITTLTHQNGGNSSSRSPRQVSFFIFIFSYSTNFFLQLDYMCLKYWWWMATSPPQELGEWLTDWSGKGHFLGWELVVAIVISTHLILPVPVCILVENCIVFALFFLAH